MLKPRLAVDPHHFRPTEPDQWRHWLARLHGIGYRGLGLHLSDPGTDSPDLAALLRDTGLGVAWVEADWDDTADSPAPALDAPFEAARGLGTTNVCVRPLGRPGGGGPRNQRAFVAAAAARWRLAALRAADHGLRVLWVLDSPHETPRISDLEPILHAVDRPNFGLVFDAVPIHELALGEGHEYLEEGKSLPGALGFLERFKGSLGTIRLPSTLEQLSDPGIDWLRLIPALADAWLPDPWWSVAPRDFEQASATAASLLNRLEPFLTDATVRA